MFFVFAGQEGAVEAADRQLLDKKQSYLSFQFVRFLGQSICVMLAIPVPRIFSPL
jgi:hypothetical protein